MCVQGMIDCVSTECALSGFWPTMGGYYLKTSIDLYNYNSSCPLFILAGWIFPVLSSFCHFVNAFSFEIIPCSIDINISKIELL